MALPTTREIHGKWVNPVTGLPYDTDDFVAFEPYPERWTDTTGDQILTGGGTENLNSTGEITVDLVCTDAPGVLPADGRLWCVKEFVNGVWRDPYFIEVPIGVGTLELAEIQPVEVADIVYVPVPGPTGPQGDPGLGAELVGFTSGVITGGEMNVNVGNPIAVDIGETHGVIANYVDTPFDPEITQINLLPQTVVLDAAAQLRAVTWWLVDINGAIIQQPGRPTNPQRRTHIVLGVTAQSLGVIFACQSIPVILPQTGNQLVDLMDALGAFNIDGNRVSAASSGTLRIQNTAGHIFSRGFNRFADDVLTADPHVSPSIAQNPTSHRYLLRNTTSLTGTVTTLLNAAQYDNNGVLTNVGGGANSSTVQRVWMFPSNTAADQIFIEYGQTVYSTLDQAAAAITLENHISNPALGTSAVLLCYIAIRRTATNTTSTSDARFVPAAKFGTGPTNTADALAQYALLAGADFTGPVTFERLTSALTAIGVHVDLDSFERLLINADGDLAWGDGNVTQDVLLERSGVGQMTSPDSWDFGDLQIDGRQVERPTASVTDYLNLNPFTCAHRGAGSDFGPEHTMEAYSQAVAAGAPAIEVSCDITSDGVLVCFHDTSLDRMTDYSGSCQDYTYSQLSNIVKVNAKDHLGDGWPYVTIPKLGDVLDAYMGKVVIFLEPKTNAATDKLTGGWLEDKYPDIADQVIWKVYYTNSTKAWAQSKGMRVWSYIDAGTTMLQMDPYDANTDFWGVPHTATDAKILEVIARPGGKSVMVWEVHRFYDVTRLTGLGVRGLMQSRWGYLNVSDNEVSADQFHTKINTGGYIGVDATLANYALKYDASARAYIQQIPNNAVLMGKHKIPAASTSYTIAFSFTWAAIPGTNLHSGIAFEKSDDRAYIFSAANATGGYHIVFRNNGTMQIFRHDAGVTTGVQLASVATVTPIAGAKMDFEVAVTPTTITCTRLDGVGAPFVASTSDTTYRNNKFWHLSPGSVTVANTTPLFEDIEVG